MAIFVWANLAKSPSADSLDKNVHLYFFNVGQGDSEMIEMGNYQILIDGGPDDSVLKEIAKVMPNYDRKIEIVILTHPHADHLAGLNSVLDRYEIGRVYYSGVKYSSNGYDEFLSKIGTKKIDSEVPDISKIIEPFPNANLEFLWPGKKYDGQSVDADLNNTSEVTKFCYLSHCTLFTGDIETDEQKLMIENYKATPDMFASDILKIPHHGSTNGTDQSLLDAVKPKTAVIEVGVSNNYGHPHAPTLDLLNKNNIGVYRTDRDNTVEFVISESGIAVKR